MNTEMWEILVPASNNKDKEFSYEHHKEWDAFVKKITGGVTVMKTAKGEWLSPIGRLHIDRMIPCRIMCNKKQIIKIIDFTIEHYNQEAILAYRISDNVIMRHKNEKIKTLDNTLSDNEVTHTVFFGENIKRVLNIFKINKS
jgi:hypothetical protein